MSSGVQYNGDFQGVVLLESGYAKAYHLAETQRSTVTPQKGKYLENYDVRNGDLNGFGLRAPPRAQIR